MHQRKSSDAAEIKTNRRALSANARRKQQRMMLIRSNASKNFLSINTAQIAILCVILVIGMFGFACTWMALEIKTADHVDNTKGNLRSTKQQYEKIRKQHAGKDVADANFVPPFQLVSEGAPECYELESPDEISVTLVTQVSHDRLWMMEHHCDRYRNKQGGPLDQHKMSIAVYSNSTLDEILDELREMNCGVADKAGDYGNDNDAPVVVSLLDAKTHGAYNNFPVNELRNLALSKVQTTHILYIDVDFWPNDNLYEIIMGGAQSTDNSGDDDPSQTIRQELVNDPKLALVIPAFQLWRQCHEWEDCRERNFPHMEAAREFTGLVHEIVENHSITLFDPKNKGGHGSTDYKVWFHQSSGSLHDIPCLQSNRYEPFVMVRYCKDLPPFQNAFAGYGKNKVTWMMQVIASGYIFSQVGGTYLVHYPHLDSASRQLWNGGATSKPALPIRKTDSKRGRIDQLFVDFKAWLEEKIPSEIRRMEVCDDAQDDDSKLWVEAKPSNEVKKSE